MVQTPHNGAGYQPRFCPGSRWDEPPASSTADLLLRLPTEVLQHIAALLRDFRASYALYRTCKTLQRATARSLYSDISLHGWPQIPVGLYLTHPRLLAFCIHVLKNPDHAARVKNLSLAAVLSVPRELYLPEEQDYWPACPEGMDEALSLAAEAQAISKDERMEWLIAVHRIQDKCPNTDSVLALLLPYLPNLERAFFRMPRYAPYLARVLHRATKDMSQPSRLEDGDVGVLNNLREVVLTFDEYQRGMRPDFFARFIRLPGVRCMRTHYMGTGKGGIDGDLEREMLPPRSSACECIEMVQSRLSDNDLHIVLDACRNLKMFRYELFWGYVSWSSPTMSSLQASLRLHVSSLEQLWLDLTHGKADRIDNILYTLMRFGDFKKLRHLKINPVFLLTKDELQGEDEYFVEGDDAIELPFAVRILHAIPAGIQRLCFTNLSTGLPTITEGCIQLLQGCKRTHPALQELTFELACDPDHPQDILLPAPVAREILLPVQVAAQTSGVEFVVRKQDHDEAYPRYGGVGSRWGLDGTCEVPELAADGQRVDTRNFPPVWDPFSAPDNREA